MWIRKKCLQIWVLNIVLCVFSFFCFAAAILISSSVSFAFLLASRRHILDCLRYFINFICFDQWFILHGCATRARLDRHIGYSALLEYFFLFLACKHRSSRIMWQKIARKKKLEIFRSNLMSLAKNQKKKHQSIHWFYRKCWVWLHHHHHQIENKEWSLCRLRNF